jgi:glycosyltransferase involved in cell wall biosynthesis
MKVSVCLIAYNHEPYIEQAVRGVLEQRTNFDYEIVVGEDHSTDQTLRILHRLQEEYPEKVRLLTADQNLGMNQNYIRTFQACEGEYVALLDGDDYWCSEDKLQKQVDFLDQQPDFAICFHSVLRVDDDVIQQPKIMRPRENKSIFDISDLINFNFIPTCSAVIRRGSIAEFPGWAYTLSFLDWLLFILAAEHGKIKYIDDVMGVYRVHSSGLWSSMDPVKRLKSRLDYFEKLDPYLDYKYTKQIQSNLNRFWRKLMDQLYERAILKDTDKAALAYVEENYTSLKDRQSLPSEWRTELLERVYCHYLIGNYERGNYPAAWSAWLGLMKNSPALRRNWGLILIGLESMANGRFRPLILRFKRSEKSKNDG